MKMDKLLKIFGVGLKGGVISLALLLLFIFVNKMMGSPTIMAHSLFIKVAGSILIIVGIALHLWTAWTLRNWWVNDQLCIVGPFSYFRHPMYAAWITFISFGTAFLLNSWTYVLWAILLHPIWHRLVIKEETMMFEIFKNEYSAYTKHVRRFIPTAMPGRYAGKVE
jgi:protein-S-isoprenylcysteine O-methyltransferase Ste14